MKVVLLAFRPTPPLLSAVLPVKPAGTVAARNALPAAGAVTEAVIGAVLSKVKGTALPGKLFPTVLIAFACTVVTPSLSEAPAGSVALLVHAPAVVPAVARVVVA